MAFAEVYPVQQTISVSGKVDPSIDLTVKISRILENNVSCFFDAVPICRADSVFEDAIVDLDESGRYSFHFNTWIKTGASRAESNRVFDSFWIFPAIKDMPELPVQAQSSNFIVFEYSNPAKLEPGYKTVPSLATDVAEADVGVASASGQLYSYTDIKLKNGGLIRDVGQAGPSDAHGLPVLMLTEKNAPVSLHLDIFRIKNKQIDN
jgi:hypothetical protein